MQELGFNYITAHFTNNERTTVEIHWHDTNKESATYNQVVATACEAVENDAQYRELMTIINEDQLHENTFNMLRAQKEQLEKSILQVAREQGLLYNLEDAPSADLYKTVAEMIFRTFDEDLDKEKLFMLKLQLFELPVIKNSKNREAKANLRKAQTFMSAIKYGILIAEETIEAEKAAES